MEHEIHNKYSEEIQVKQKKIENLQQEKQMQVYQYERQIQDIDIEVKSKFEKREKMIRDEFEMEVEGLSK